MKRPSPALPCPALAALLLSCCFGSHALAYNPPVDTAGPLSVRIEGPETVTQTETPLPVRVIVKNTSDRRVEGTLELKLVDRWLAEPARAVQFAVDGKSTSTHEFQVTAGRGTYNAHYPIHAFARFQLDGEEQTVHPVLVLQTKLPRAPRVPVPLPWKPFCTSADGQLALGRMPLRRCVVQVFGEAPQTMPTGWQGAESRSKGSFYIRPETLAGETRQAIGIHPPWFEGRAGTLLVEFPLQLPKTTPLRLHFATATTATGQGDGVTFRVRVLPLDAPAGKFGKTVFERHTDAKTWQEAQVDLSEFAAQAVRLQFESHPGPKNDTGWDQSYWAEPTLVAGTPVEALPFPPKDEEGSFVLGRVGVAVPATAKRIDDARQQPYEVRIWPGRRGLLDAVVGFGEGEKRLYFRGFEIRVLGGRIDDARSPMRLQEVKREAAEDGGYQVRHRFQSISAAFDLVGRLAVHDGALQAKFQLENTPPPQSWSAVYLEDVAVGPWDRSVENLYFGHGHVVKRPGAFRIGLDGHRLSTSFVGFDFDGGPSLVQAVDVPPDRLEVQPKERHYSLHTAHACTLTFIPTENVFEGAKQWRKINGLRAAGGVKKAAGRFVFDLWGGHYRQSGEALRRAFRYGLTDSMVVWHNWQRWGYDYRLPEIYPPNPRLGTEDELRQMIDTCRQAAVPFALHDNYIDLYPDAEGFSYEKMIAFGSDGRPVKAWLNEGRGARSYRYRSDVIEPFLKDNLKLLRDNLAPSAYFIDVWSSIAPYDYWTADGRFFDRVYTRDTWGKLFSWIRDYLGDDAPQISESGHDQLIGHLDAAQTNHLRIDKALPGKLGWMVIDIPHADTERIPWFDVAHHDRFILHGAGYSYRYQGGLDGRLHGIYSDDYMATEVLTGHPAMVPEPFNRDVVRKYWLLGELMRALALRTIESVEFVDGDLHRQYVRWSDGGEVWVNRGQPDWTAAGQTLPQYGFVAKVPTDAGIVEASITRRDGLIVEMARSARQVYINGRQVIDDRLPVRVKVEKVQQQQDRRFTMSLAWQLDEPIPEGFVPFVHFVNAPGEIVFQAHQDAKPFANRRTGKFTTTVLGGLPEDAKPGDSFELRIGFYRPAGGRRLAIAGNNDGEQRIRIGTLKIGDDGNGLSFTPLYPKEDPFLARQNPEGKPIDFGPAVTAGGCRITRDGNAIVVTPLPSKRGPKSPVRLRPDQFPWQVPEPTHVETVSEDGTASNRRPVRRDGDAVLLECGPGTFAYRLTRN